MGEAKEKSATSLRQPKAKKPLGLKVRELPNVGDPHAFIKAPEIMPGQPGTSSPISQTRPLVEQPIAPQRDFARVANSITREAVPAGLFKGKSKQLYDCLYALTRGAVVPTRAVRIPRPALMKKAGIGARVTFEANMTHLQNVGLIVVRQIAGEHEGNEYTVFLPEDTSMPSQTRLTSLTRLTSQAQKLVRLVSLETSQTRHSLFVENKGTFEEPKTSFKTIGKKTDDDEAFAKLVELFKQVTAELTGKSPTSGEQDRWREFAELIVAELKIAAARTGTVSSVPAFLTEHLRRRLWKKDKAQLDREAKEASVEWESKQGVDVSKCPDCGGSGWWYPDGPERGVAKCKHERLSSKES